MKSHGFVKVPNIWREQLLKVKARGTTYHVALVILDKGRWSEWVTLSNGALGLDRRLKYIALKELRAANLIIAEERKGKSPRVKPLFRK
jgi:hypothetical protein